MRLLTPIEIILNAEIEDERHFKRVVRMTILGAIMLGFSIGFVIGFLLK